MTSPLENLSGPGKSLQKEPRDAKEFAGLKRSGLARLSDAGNPANSLEGRFDLAYNAAHALCLAALRWQVTDRPTATLCFKYYRIRSAWDRKSGACLPNATRSAISASTKVI